MTPEDQEIPLDAVSEDLVHCFDSAAFQLQMFMRTRPAGEVCVNSFDIKRLTHEELKGLVERHRELFTTLFQATVQLHCAHKISEELKELRRQLGPRTINGLKP